MGLRVQPKGPVVTLGHADLPLLLPRAGGAGLHGGRERARLAVLPGEHGQASFGPSVAVVLVQMAGAQARRRPRGLVRPRVGLGGKAGRLPLGGRLPGQSLCPLALALGARLVVGARPLHPGAVLVHEAAACQAVQQLAVVGDEQPYAGELSQRVRELNPARGVHVVRGLVEHQHVGALPKGDGRLDLFRSPKLRASKRQGMSSSMPRLARKRTASREKSQAKSSSRAGGSAALWGQ